MFLEDVGMELSSTPALFNPVIIANGSPSIYGHPLCMYSSVYVPSKLFRGSFCVIDILC